MTSVRSGHFHFKNKDFVQNQPYTIQAHGCHAEKRGEDAIFLAMTRKLAFSCELAA